jgi:hypothetical protein
VREWRWIEGVVLLIDYYLGVSLETAVSGVWTKVKIACLRSESDKVGMNKSSLSVEYDSAKRTRPNRETDSCKMCLWRSHRQLTPGGLNGGLASDMKKV